MIVLKYSRDSTIDIIAQALATNSLIAVYGLKFFDNEAWWDELLLQQRDNYRAMATLVVDKLTEER